MMKKIIVENLEVSITYKKIKNIIIKVKEGNLVVSAPLKVNDEKIVQAIEKNLEKIKLVIAQKRYLGIHKRELFDGDEVLFLGKKYKVFFVNTRQVFIKDESIFTKSQSQLLKWQKQQAEIIISRIYNDLNYITKPTLVFKFFKGKWGSYNKKTKLITINYQLIMANVEQIVFVLYHELAHTIVLNHSKAFYNELAKVLPNHRVLRKQLKDYVLI